MRLSALAAAALLPVAALAGSPTGIYQTGPGDTGGFLYVAMAPCGSNPELTCGSIVAAYDRDGKRDDGYQHLGRAIVWDMVDEGDGAWGAGMVWDPDQDKTYAFSMELEGEILHVARCVAMVCDLEDWRRIQ